MSFFFSSFNIFFWFIVYLYLFSINDTMLFFLSFGFNRILYLLFFVCIGSTCYSLVCNLV